MIAAVTSFFSRTPVVTWRAALALVIPVPVVPFLPGPTGGIVAAVWFVTWAALVVRDIRSAPGAESIGVSRELPLKLSIGVPNPVRITLVNRAERPAVLRGRDTPPAAFRGESHFGPVSLEPLTLTTLTWHVTPPRRGAFAFGSVAVRSLGPLGLAGRQFAAPLAEECRVYPDITAVRRYALLARKGALNEIGIKAALMPGVGTDFESLRDYQPGDGYREVDWKATARRGKPVVRRFQSERSQTVVIAIDAGRLMLPVVSGLAKLDRAINAALLLAYLGTQADDHVGLLVFGKDVRTYVPPRKGHRQFLAILEALASVDGALEEPDYPRALTYLSRRLSKRALVVVFSDLAGTEPSRRLLRVLAAMTPRHLPLVITQRNRDIEAKARADVTDELAVFSASVAEGLLRDKAEALGSLAARGTLVLDVVPEDLSVAAVNRYLEIKARGRL